MPGRPVALPAVQPGLFGSATAAHPHPRQRCHPRQRGEGPAPRCPRRRAPASPRGSQVSRCFPPSCCYRYQPWGSSREREMPPLCRWVSARLGFFPHCRAGDAAAQEAELLPARSGTLSLRRGLLPGSRGRAAEPGPRRAPSLGTAHPKGLCPRSCVCCWPQQGEPRDTGWRFPALLTAAQEQSQPSPGASISPSRCGGHRGRESPLAGYPWSPSGVPRQVRSPGARTLAGARHPPAQPSAAGGRKLPRRRRAKKRQGLEQPGAASYLF